MFVVRNAKSISREYFTNVNKGHVNFLVFVPLRHMQTDILMGKKTRNKETEQFKVLGDVTMFTCLTKPYFMDAYSRV